MMMFKKNMFLMLNKLEIKNRKRLILTMNP